MLTPIRTVAPAEPPISVSELKAHLRVDSTDEDALIGTLLDAAVQHVDGYSGVLGRALVTQTWTQDFDDWDDLCLALAPISSVTVTYYDTANAQQTLSAPIYSLLAGPAGPYIKLNWGQVFPNLFGREDAIRVTMVAGYGAATTVPAPIKAAIMLLAGHWYANREAVGQSSLAELPMAVNALLAPYRRVGV
jgi:uncharacterized phiE125 gp8 family phage protein